MRVQNEMATRISIDAVGATHSLKGLSDAVRGATNAWKAQVAYQNSVGNSLGAAKAKYEGLGNAIDQQKSKINELRNRQKELNVTNTESVEKYQKYQTEIDKLRAEQTKLDTSTKEGKDRFAELSRQIDDTREAQSKNTGITQKDAEEYLKLNKNISSSENQLRSYEKQQERAAKSVKYYESGLAGLQKSHKENNAVSKSFTERLKAEGKGASATVAEYNHLRSSLKSLRSQYNLQEKEQGQLAEKVKIARNAYERQEDVVKRVAREHGKTSKEYKEARNTLNRLDAEVKESESDFKKQSVRVNETGKNMAEAANKTKSMRHEVSRLQPTGIKRIDNAVVRVKDHTGSMAEHAKAGFAKFKNAALGASVAAGTLVAGMAKGAKMASTLQNTYNENTNLLVTSGEKTKDVTKEIAEMQKDGRKYSIQYSESQKNIASGYQELVKRGYDGQQSLGAMKSILQASKASGDDFSDTMQVTTSTLEAFGMRTSSTAGMMRNTKEVANKLAMAADATSTDFKSLGVGMNYVGTSAHTAGLSLGNTASAMGVLSNSGLEAQQAGTGLRKILISLKTPTDSAAASMKKYGMSVSDFKDKSGKLKPVADIFEEIGQKVPKGEQANFFHNVFGTTGQNAAAILATNTSELKKVNEQVGGAYKNNYVGKLANKNMKSTQNSVKQFKEAANAVLINLGTALMPALSKAAKRMAKAFNDPDVQKGLKVIASGIGTVADKAVDFVVFLGKHSHDVKVWGEVLLAAFAGKKLVNGVSWLTESMGTIHGLFGSISKSAGKNAISSEMEGVASSAKSANGSTGAMLGSIKKMPASLKAVSAGLAALPAIMDVGGQIATTINTPTTKNKIALASKGLGASIGGVAGFAIGGPIGAGIGATVGDQLGSSKTAQSIVGKMSKFINKAMKGTKIKAPRMDTKDAKKSLNEYSKVLYKQQLKDAKTLHDAGAISDKAYADQVKQIKKYYKDRTNAAKKGGSNENVVARYYAKQRQDIDTSYNKQKKKIRNKYQTETDRAERTFGKKSIQYQKAKARQEKAEDNARAKHKKQISNLNIKYAENDMTKEAKAHMTLAGRIQSSSDRQSKTLKNLRDKKKNYSQSALKKIVADSNKEYRSTTKNADKQYNRIAKAADKQRAKVASAADRQYKAAKAAADNQYQKTVDAANRQYKGHGKAAEKQRKSVIKKAKDQRDKSIDSAENQRKNTVEKADKQRQQTVDKAEKQRQDTTTKAKKQRDDIKGAAKDQGYHVSKSHAKQANDSMKASSKQASGMQGIWNAITGWWSKFLKSVGIKAPAEHNAKYGYTPVTYPNASKYDIGGAVGQSGKALVGEAGPELRYTPYSGKVDVLGRYGAEFADVKSGQQILNAKDTARLMSGGFKGTLPGYAKGTLSLSGFLGKIKDGASDIWDKISDAASSLFDKVTHPKKTIEAIATKAFNLDKVSHLGSIPRGYSKGMVKKLVDGVVAKFNEMKDAIAEAGDVGSGGGGHVSGSHSHWLKQAGFRSGEIPAANWLVTKESGWRTNATNPDSGAYGLAQALPPSKYSSAGSDWRTNPLTQLKWMAGYVHGRYGNAKKAKSWHLSHNWYANGGRIDNAGLYHLAEGNKPEYVIPTDVAKRPRAWSLLKEVVEQFAGDTEMNSQSVSQHDNFDELSKKVDTMIDRFDSILGKMNQVIGGQSIQTQEIKSASDPTNRYKSDGLKQSMLNFQAH